MILHFEQKGNDCIWKLQCYCIQILHSDIYSVIKKKYGIICKVFHSLLRAACFQKSKNQKQIAAC